MVQGDLHQEVLFLTEDSRMAGPGCVFVAIKGEQVDGHRYVSQALAHGAVGVVVDHKDLETFPPFPQSSPSAFIAVKNSRMALGILAAQFYGVPSKKLTMVGVTGTNGKTTVTHIAKALLETRGHQVGLLGTVGYEYGRERMEASHTTPPPVVLQEMLQSMVKANVEVGVLEVSSHALALDRVAGCEFDIVVFTNLTQDHLDFHGSEERYFQAKLRLFTDYVDEGQKSGPKRALVNIDDRKGEAILRQCSIPVWTYGIHGPADIQAEAVRLTMEGTDFVVKSPRGLIQVQSPLVGEHNVSNLLAAIGIGLEMGMTPTEIEGALGLVRNVPGRFERIDEGQDFLVVVDYAHTEDALRRLLQAAETVKEGRIITLFGCGGDRDKGKRGKMGQVAVSNSDLVIVTSDNPRTEDPQEILNQIEMGITLVHPESRCSYRLIPDRREAIRFAIEQGQSDDLVLIAGKGHENYQIVGKEKIHFDDREEAKKALRQRMNRV